MRDSRACNVPRQGQTGRAWQIIAGSQPCAIDEHGDRSPSPRPCGTCIGCAVALRLEIHTYHLPGLIDGSPQVILLTIDYYENLIAEDDYTITWRLSSQLTGIKRSEHYAAQPDSCSAHVIPSSPSRSSVPR